MDFHIELLKDRSNFKLNAMDIYYCFILYTEQDLDHLNLQPEFWFRSYASEDLRDSKQYFYYNTSYFVYENKEKNILYFNLDASYDYISWLVEFLPLKDRNKKFCKRFFVAFRFYKYFCKLVNKAKKNKISYINI